MFFARYIVLVGFLFCLLFSSTSHADELESNVIALVDFSGSYFTEDRLLEQIPKNIKDFSLAVSSKRRGPDRPSLIQVLPINAISEISKPICEYKLLRRSLLGGKNKKCGTIPDAFCSAKTDELKEYFIDECTKIVSSFSPDSYTDISGALALASQLIDNQRPEKSYLIIFSDMFELRVDILPFSKIDLKGAKVLVVCGGGFYGETDIKKLCFGTEESWRSQLLELGASSVEYAIETSRWVDGLAEDFFSR